MAKRYTRINFQNAPSTATPLNAANLNKMDKGIDDLDNAIEALSDTLVKTSYNMRAYQDSVVSTSGGTLNKSNNNVVMTGYAILTSALAANSVTTIFTLPVGLRPSIQIYCPCTLYSSDGMMGGFMTISTDGTVKVYNRSAETTFNSVTFTVTFAV